MRKRSIISFILVLFLAISPILNSNYSYAQDAQDNVENKIEVRDYSLSELNDMDYDTLINTLVEIEWSQMVGISDYDKYTIEFYTDEDRMDRILQEIKRRGSLFTKDDDLGLRTLIVAYRMGYFYGSNNEGELKDLYSNFDKKKECEDAINAIITNPNFKLGSRTQDILISEVGSFLNNTYTSVDTFNNLVPFFEDFATNMDEYSKDRAKQSAVYKILNGSELSLKSYVMYDLRQQPEDSVYYKKIDNYLDTISDILYSADIEENKEDVNDNLQFILNHIFYKLSYMGKFHTEKNFGNEALTYVMDNYSSDTMQHIQAAERIKFDYKGINARGEEIDYNLLKEDAKDYYLPNEYYFDNNSIIIKTGDKVEKEKVKRLYFAAKEVKAQVFRSIKSDKAVDNNNNDDPLNIVIYNSPKEYDMNRLIYGMNTSNGGLYVEPITTFFTYERTPQESIYTLEELFRHEYTHYLQGRYIVPGLWGRGDFYSDGQLNWYDEGSAEFFAGSTRYDGIKARSSMVSGFANRQSNWYDANKTMHSKYGSFEFYKYAFAMIDYMHQNYSTFEYLTDCIKRNDYESYHKYIEDLSNDESFNEAYQNHMKELEEKYNDDELEIPLVDDVYLDEHEVKSMQEVKNNILSLINLSNVKIQKLESDFFNTFALRGEFKLNNNLNSSEEYYLLNDKVNEVLTALDEKDWAGYKTITAYFANPREIAGKKVYDVVFHGILTDEEFVGDIIETPSDDNDKTTDEDNNKNDKDNNKNDDNNNKNDDSNNDNNNGDDKDESVERLPIGVVTDELFNNNSISSTIALDNDRMIYSFEVVENSTVNIEVLNNSNKTLNWLLYGESDFKNYITFAKRNGNKLEDNIDLNSGKYYLLVYTPDKNITVDFDILVDGIKEKEVIKEDNDDENEVKKNNDFSNAIDVNANEIVTIDANLDDAHKTVYKLNLDEAKDLNIVVQTNDKLNWLIYKEDDLVNYDGFATDIKDYYIAGNYEASKGSYYLVIYNYEGTGGRYRLNVR
ncbi:MAG: collagenase [Peptostreptococcaceae bacterium]|jgi:microbial collagenase|nr:collagenase [Peptostreptococcaceae bacterium]